MKNAQNIWSTTLRIALFMLVVVCLPVRAAIVIKIAHEEPGDASRSAAQLSAEVFKDVIESRSNGEMKVQIHPNSDLGNQHDRLKMTQSNIIQVDIASMGGLAQFYPNINAIDIPFAFPSAPVAYRVFDGPFGKKLAANMQKKTGLKLLAVTAGDFYVLTNSVRQIKTPADMKGIKFRTMAVPTQIAMMKALGAAATPVPWDELYSSLQTGVVQGEQNPIPIIAIGKLQEVQKYATLTNHLFGADWWVTNQQFYNSLSPKDRRIFLDAVQAAKIAGRGAKLRLRATRYGASFLRKAGLKVYSPTPKQLTMFREKVMPATMAAIQKEVGKSGVKMAHQFLHAVKVAEKTEYQSTNP